MSRFYRTVIVSALFLFAGCSSLPEPERAAGKFIPPQAKRVCVSALESVPDVYLAWYTTDQGSAFACFGCTDGEWWNAKIDRMPAEKEIFLLNGSRVVGGNPRMEIVARTPGGESSIYYYELTNRELHLTTQMDFAWAYKKSPLLADARFPEKALPVETALVRTTAAPTADVKPVAAPPLTSGVVKTAFPPPLPVLRPLVAPSRQPMRHPYWLPVDF